jgi:hypothetical protein
MKKAFLTWLLFASAAYAPTIYAQCATGVDTGGQCIPPEALSPQSGSNPHPRPQQTNVVWASRWGAIAIDSGTSSVGISENQTNKSAASAEALQRCASKSDSQHCEVELAYYNQCAALAWGTKYFGKGRAETIAQAQSLALRSCQEGASDCKVVYSACSLPVRVQ